MIEIQKEMYEHINKELCKKVVENTPNFTDIMKSNLKAIIDAGQSPQEIYQASLAYLSTCIQR